jgi:dihydropteroate synthase
MAATLSDILESHRTGRPVVMGILNVTPDSFSDSGQFFEPAKAVQHARQMAAEGADILDVGAESTRPGSERVNPDEQIRRLQHVLPEVLRLGPIVSIDTSSSIAAAYALDAGAAMVNDVTAGRDDPAILPLAAKRGCALVLMHMLGEPRTMQQDPQYGDVVAEVKQFLVERLAAAEQAGVERRMCIIDPGIGFGKKLEHNLLLIAGIGELARLGVPVMLGSSRKRFIGALTGQDQPAQRLPGSIAAALEGYARGATIFRVHDVAPTVQALAVAWAVRKMDES